MIPPRWLLPILFLSTTALADSQFLCGHARFTVITPHLVRMEYSPTSDFVDDPSYFAANRQAQSDATGVEENGVLRIATTGFALQFKDNGKPFSPDNLTITLPGTSKPWHPGDKPSGNLGGTIRTVDGVSAPVSLGEGVLSRDGWYLLDDSKSVLLTNDGWVKSRPTTAGIDWYFFAYGNDNKAALQSLTAIGGKVPLPRRYSLGTYYSRYWNYTADEFKQIVEEYREMEFPLDVIVMDMDWHVTQYEDGKKPAGWNGQIWTGYTWDKKLIPKPAALLKWFHDQGLAVTLNDHPADGVQPHEEMYDAFMRAMGADPATKETIPFDAGDRNYMETFWKFTHEPREQEGVDFWWLDWQQYPFTRSIPDLTNLAWLNEFYTRMTGVDGKRGQSLSRWAGWGDHRHPIHFSGDAGSTWPMLAFEVALTSTAGNVGCFFWSHDIGGHWGARNDEMYARWCQFGAMSPALRSHSTRDAQNDRRPWSYEPWALESMKRSFQLRARLFPYIYSSVAQSCRDSLPLCRPMYLEHPNLQQSNSNWQQYYFGEHLLVAPIAMPGSGENRFAWQRVWFPEGQWVDWFTGEAYSGGEERIVACDLNTFPLFVRAGTPIAMRPFTQRPASEPISTLTVRVYPGQNGASQLYEDDGISTQHQSGLAATTNLAYQRDGDVSTITIAPAKGRFAGQLNSRAYLIELPFTQLATSATVDGQRVDVKYDEQSMTNTIAVPERAIDKGVTVVVTAAPVAQQVLRERATGARLARAGEDDQARLAARGIALMTRDDSAYGFAGTRTLRLYAPDGAVKPQECGASLISTDGGEQRVSTVSVTPGQPIDLSPVAGGIEVHGQPQIVALTVRVDGKDVELRHPAAGLVKPSSDLALKSTATASSCEKGYTAQGAIDGIADGYPHRQSSEWASDGQKAGATIRLTWNQPVSASRVVLFDRPNRDDQVLGGKLRFSDGSSVTVGELQNDGTVATTVEFPRRTFNWMELEITVCSDKTKNAGIAEIGVFE